MLPVFGHAEEAETFLQASGGSGWQIRETGAGELVSVLFDRYANIRKIALDPLAPVAGAEVLPETGGLALGAPLLALAALFVGIGGFASREVVRASARVESSGFS